MSEAKISSALRKGLDAYGCFVQKTNDSRTQGIPDLVGCSPAGRHLVVETKLIKAWPARESSLVLKSHPVTRAQAKHLEHVAIRDGLAFIAVGFPDHAALTEMPGIPGSYGCALIAWEMWVSLWEKREKRPNPWADNVERGALIACLEAWRPRMGAVAVAKFTGSMSSTFRPPPGLFG